MKHLPCSEAEDERTCGISGILANQERYQERLKATASIPDNIRDLIRDAILAATRESTTAG